MSYKGEYTMRTQRGLSYGLTLTALLGLALFGWTHNTPASAEGDANKPAPGPPMHSGPATIAASGDYVYVLRGGTLYQLKSADLSLVTQQDLPPPRAGGTGAPAADAA